MNKRVPKIDTRDMQQMLALALPIFLLLTVDYMFEDMFKKMPPEFQMAVVLGLVFAVALVYQQVLKKWMK